MELNYLLVKVVIYSQSSERTRPAVWDHDCNGDSCHKTLMQDTNVLRSGLFVALQNDRAIGMAQSKMVSSRRTPSGGFFQHV